jgi:hypothetical protein
MYYPNFTTDNKLWMTLSSLFYWQYKLSSCMFFPLAAVLLATVIPRWRQFESGALCRHQLSDYLLHYKSPVAVTKQSCSVNRRPSLHVFRYYCTALGPVHSVRVIIVHQTSLLCVSSWKFSVRQIDLINECMFFLGVDSVSVNLQKRFAKFVARYVSSENKICQLVSEYINQ